MKMLPLTPHLEFLRREARALKRQHRRRDPKAHPVIRHFDSSLYGLSAEQLFDTRFSILDAQRTVARQYGFASWARLKTFCQSGEPAGQERDLRLRQWLLDNNARAESMTHQMRGSKERSKEQQRLLADYKALARRYTERLLPLLEDHGWPGPARVGFDGAAACFSLVGHATWQADLQYSAARQLHAAPRHGGVDSRCYAMISDRYRSLAGQQVVYAITPALDASGRLGFDRNCIDPPSLNRRRANVGYDAIDDHDRERLAEARHNGEDLRRDPGEWADYVRGIAEEGGYRKQREALDYRCP